jgi:DNA modification methylase
MSWTLLNGDALEMLKTLPDESVHCCVTSPPYWGLRDYGVDGQLGLESTPDEYVANMVEVFREVKRVLRKDGTLWLNLGDSYATTPTGSYGSKSGLHGAQTSAKYKQTIQEVYTKKSNTVVSGLKPKDLVGIPWRAAFALQADGWWLRSDIIWAKPNPMPESVQDRPTKAHEYIFLLTKSERYYYDADAIKENSVDPQGSAARYKYAFSGRDGLIMPDGKPQQIAPKGIREFSSKRNKRTVWNITTKPYKEAHFATFPPEIPEICIKAGCPEGGIVLDPFAGSGTTLWVAEQLGVDSIGIELNPEYCELIEKRMNSIELDLFAMEGR